MNFSRRRFLKLLGAAGIAASYPVFVERYIILSNTYRIPVHNLPPAFAGFRIVHLTDIHHGPLMPLGMVRHVVERTNQLKRDIVVCTGDNVRGNCKITQIDQVWPILSKLTAPSGVLSVLGNHDHWANTERSEYWLGKTGQNLRHKTACIERNGQRLWFAGAGDLWEDHKPLDQILWPIPENDCRIVLAHNPDTADTLFTNRVDLMISGHTHGGQVNIPFVGTPILPVQNKNYSSGLKTSPDGTKIFISKGIGWTVCPIRFNCFPEIAILELIPG